MRAREEDGALIFEDPITLTTWTARTDGDEVELYGETKDGRGLNVWLRTSDAASIGDWLRRNYAACDWRDGANPTSASIPLDTLEPNGTIQVQFGHDPGDEDRS